MRAHELCDRFLEDVCAHNRSTPGSQAVYSLNALGSGPLAYRTFGGNPQFFQKLDPEIMERAVGGHYLLTQLTQCALVKKILYPEPDSRHCLYCDRNLYEYFGQHGILELGFWDAADSRTVEENVTPAHVDQRIYYSACKPFALLHAAGKAGAAGMPVFFIDSDLILKRRHDGILKDSRHVRAAYGHQEAIGTECYPDFQSLNFPKGYRFPEELRFDLPAVNTCLMYFNDLSLLEEWAVFFKDLFWDNWVEGPVRPAVISSQLLGIDQRTFPIIADRRGLWGTEQVVPFLDIIWDPPRFLSPDGTPAEWHYYTLEPHPEHPDWLQDVMHTWISKKAIERDERYRNYQGCLMLGILLALMPRAERALRSFESLTPYFELYREFGCLEEMLRAGAVSERLNKDL